MAKKEKKTKKNNSQLIIEAMMSGEILTSRDISDLILKNSGKRINVQDLASVLAKFSNPEKCEIAHCIEREKVGTGFQYKLIEEAMKLTEPQLYDLTIKTGKYTIEQAFKEYPALKKGVKAVKPKSAKKTEKVPEKKPAKPVAVKAVKAKKAVAPTKVENQKQEPVKAVKIEEVIKPAETKKEVPKVEPVKEIENLNININVTFRIG
jgi:hypothetical protein